MGDQAATAAEKFDLFTKTTKILSININENPIRIPIARFIPIPPLLLTDETDTDIKVSKICLGTMTYGEQNTEKEAHEQLDYALEHGVNFIDTAEMYPVPPNSKTQGLTEKYIGSWIEKYKKRDRIFKK